MLDAGYLSLDVRYWMRDKPGRWEGEKLRR